MGDPLGHVKSSALGTVDAVFSLSNVLPSGAQSCARLHENKVDRRLSPALYYARNSAGSYNLIIRTLSFLQNGKVYIQMDSALQLAISDMVSLSKVKALPCGLFPN